MNNIVIIWSYSFLYKFSVRISRVYFTTNTLFRYQIQIFTVCRLLTYILQI